MQKHSILYYKETFIFRGIADGQFDSGIRCCLVSDSRLNRSLTKPGQGILKVTIPSRIRISGLDSKKSGYSLPTAETKAVAYENQEEFADEDDDELCPVECVREFKTDEEFLGILERAKQTGSLVVVDFYRTSCGSCKYIEQIFSKICKGAGDEEAKVIFLKHNVIDEYDEQSEVADRLRIRAVPLFHFYKNGLLLEAFPTRDKERIVAAILKYSAPTSA